ncbi:MAG: molybdopterin-binding protein [Candidatus Nanopelagicales bacterium]
MRTVEQQLQLILGHAPRLAPLDVPLLDTLGCVLAADVVAHGPGGEYAAVTGMPAPPGVAGQPGGSAVAVGQETVRVITTEGADGFGPHTVGTPAVARPAGSGLAPGQVVAPAGALVGEREVAAIVAAGYSRARIYPRPRVVIIPVGDDLAESGRALLDGQSHDINGPMLTAAALLAGADAFRAQPAADDVRTLTLVVEDQLVRADLIVVVANTYTSGNQPAGPVVDALASMGSVDFTFAAIDPGSVVAFGTLGADHVPVIVLPRDSATALINFEVFVRPLIRTLAGRADVFRPIERAVTSAPINNSKRLRRFIPAVVDPDLDSRGRVAATPLVARGPSAVWMREANALMVVPEDRTELTAGDQVGLIRLDRG